jgi:hypothetical protein
VVIRPEISGKIYRRSDHRVHSLPFSDAAVHIAAALETIG